MTMDPDWARAREEECKRLSNEIDYMRVIAPELSPEEKEQWERRIRTIIEMIQTMENELMNDMDYHGQHAAPCSECGKVRLLAPEKKICLGCIERIHFGKESE